MGYFFEEKKTLQLLMIFKKSYMIQAQAKQNVGRWILQ